MKYPFIGGAYRIINEKNLPINSSLKLTETNDDDLSKNYEDYNSSMSYNYSISGGFTFRKKSVILKCLKYVSLDMVLEVRKNKKLNNFLYNSKDEISESSYFQNALDILGIEIPDYDTCNEFCCVLLDKLNKNSFAICNLNKKIINKNSKEIMEYIIIKKFYH